MNNRNYDLEVKKVSDLREIDNPEDFWIFGSKDDSEGRATSVKYPFSKLEAYVKNLQLERRIALTMERTEQIVPIGEDMTVYMVKTSNIEKLEISETGTDRWTDIPLNQNINIELSAKKFNYTLRMDPKSNLGISSIYIEAKVKK